MKYNKKIISSANRTLARELNSIKNLKSIFNYGEIITMPIFSKDIVEKIIFEYIFLDHNKQNLKIIHNHFNSFKNFCFEYLYNDKSIRVVITKCN